VKPRTTTALYQTAARAWLTAAGLSLLLPPDRRLGLWLPLHLALAGAISTAISGAMQNFMLALTATPAPSAWLVRAQFALVTSGAGAIAVGMPTATAWLTGLGGTAFVAGTAVLGWMLWRAWRKALNRRHAMPIAAYGAAVGFVVLGGTFGALLGSRVIAGEAYLQLRHAHMTTNVLGWASLTVVGTLVTLLPTALRVRMPPWRGRLVLGLLVGGLSAILLGWWTGATPILATGGAAYAAGALGLVALVVSVLRVERTWGIPLAAMHMLGAAAWFVGGSLGLGVALLDGVAGFDRFRLVFLTAFVGGWLVLAAAAMLLANFLCRCHPERFVARAAARAGIVTVISAGLLQLASITREMLEDPARVCGVSLTDCVGTPPWGSLGPALAIGGAWFLISLGAARLARARRGTT